jgi:arabinan endo-1,5-alpha-L-arabinosidase
MKLLFLAATFFIFANSTAQLNPLNPVLDTNFPDPTVIQANGKYYAYATNSRGMHIQVASSTDLQHWTIVGDALPQKPSWASHDFWAPHVLYDKALKQYVMFYSGESTDTSTGKCLGVAFSNSPEGPFIDKGEPLLCGATFVNIDPMAFVDPKSGKKLLYWGSGFEPIKVQEMTSDWSAFKPGTKAQPVIYPAKEKKYDRLVEGAWVHYYNGKYYIYYSGDNCCGVNASYAVLVARADNPFGPFTTLGEQNGTGSSVILEKDATWIAPGHNSIFTDTKGNTYIAYHAIPAGNKGSQRVFCINRIEYRKGWPIVYKK